MIKSDLSTTHSVLLAMTRPVDSTQVRIRFREAFPIRVKWIPKSSLGRYSATRLSPDAITSLCGIRMDLIQDPKFLK